MIVPAGSVTCSKCGVGQTPTVFWHCNDCCDRSGSVWRAFQLDDGRWERRRVTRHLDGSWTPYEPSPEEKRTNAALADFAEWMFGSDKDDW